MQGVFHYDRGFEIGVVGIPGRYWLTFMSIKYVVAYGKACEQGKLLV